MVPLQKEEKMNIEAELGKKRSKLLCVTIQAGDVVASSRNNKKVLLRDEKAKNTITMDKLSL